MQEYHKIDALFDRDIDGTKKLIEGKFRNPTVEYLANLEWIMTEKIDGTNIRVHWDGHRIEFGGRTDRANIPANLMNYLNATFLNNETEELFEQKFGANDVILFGEGYGGKIQNGNAYRTDSSFILFDVMINGNYLERDGVEDIAKCCGIDVVPIVLRGKLLDGVEYVKAMPKSTIGSAPMEGVVARPARELNDRCGKRIIVKIKVRDFVR